MSKVLIDIDLKRIRGLIDHFGGSGSEEFEDYDQEDARNEFRDMLELIFAGQEIVGSMNEWQPIETAPKDGTRILAFFPIINSYKILTVEFIRHRWYICPYDSEFKMMGGDPTHWMPLPNPPKQEKEIV